MAQASKDPQVRISIEVTVDRKVHGMYEHPGLVEHAWGSPTFSYQPRRCWSSASLMPLGVLESSSAAQRSGRSCSVTLRRSPK
jgi:hypothetical protein